MAFNAEFAHHLHELMVEVSDNLRESEAKYKAEVIFKAQKTNNSAAMPIAYSDAAIHALRTRVSQTIEKSIEALAIFGIEIDANVERDMIHHITMLTGGPSRLDLPPVLREQNDSAIQQHFVMERARIANQLIREGKNRLRELKMKTRQRPQATSTMMITNYNSNVGTVYQNSVHHSTINLQITPPLIQDIERASEGHPRLEAAAKEIAAAPNNTTMLEKAKSWIALLCSVEGLAEKAIQHYPQIAAFIQSLK